MAVDKGEMAGHQGCQLLIRVISFSTFWKVSVSRPLGSKAIANKRGLSEEVEILSTSCLAYTLNNGSSRLPNKVTISNVFPPSAFVSAHALIMVPNLFIWDITTKCLSVYVVQTISVTIIPLLLVTRPFVCTG